MSRRSIDPAELPTESPAEAALAAAVQVRARAARKPPEVRRAEIADAARSLALEAGLAAITLRAVGAHVGVAPALVAHYQPNMDQLVADTFTAIVAAELDEVDALVHERHDPAAQLAELLATVLDDVRDDVTLVWVDGWAIGRRNARLAQAVRGQMDAWQRLVEGILADGVAAGRFETDDPATVARQLLGMLDGLNAHALVHWGEEAYRGALIARAVEGMLGVPRGTLDARPAAE
ncbi:TetR family transcriptional regulator [Agromyces protaetiae]|uniref:TetR family transcriptional regulator n=1 Tax=Agromyces protaetiae TaxID=2509455 RepID=A0A4P6FR04_9MICO|nr:TetR family transcriptional regulator C-terminal domain-containing protein [Agromyces protaetiae]QAY72958.1 TetR family transcriptional regulator [Agromyces protaetiae]